MCVCPTDACAGQPVRICKPTMCMHICTCIIPICLYVSTYPSMHSPIYKQMQPVSPVTQTQLDIPRSLQYTSPIPSHGPLGESQSQRQIRTADLRTTRTSLSRRIPRSSAVGGIFSLMGGSSATTAPPRVGNESKPGRWAVRNPPLEYVRSSLRLGSYFSPLLLI